jgi:hypothetical protein
VEQRGAHGVVGLARGGRKAAVDSGWLTEEDRRLCTDLMGPPVSQLDASISLS